MRAWLSPSGTLSAALVGAAVWLGEGWRGVLLLAVFLVTSSWLTPGGGRRRAAQVFANGGLAAGCALLAHWNAGFGAAFAGALAAATADTWSTEIGAHSRRAPRLITTWQTVPHGTDGGVTLLGSAGGALGAVVIAVGAVLLGLVPGPAAPWVALGGVVGTALDSLVGATLQRRSWLNNDAVNLLATAAGAAVTAWLA